MFRVALGVISDAERADRFGESAAAPEQTSA